MKKRRFIFDENYNKKHGKKNLSKLLIVLAAVLVLIVVIIIIILAVNANKKQKEPTKPVNKEPVFELKESITLESGSLLPSKEDYFLKLENMNLDNVLITYPNDFELSYNTDECTEVELASTEDVGTLSCAKQNLLTPANYGILVKVNNEEYVVPIEIKDTTAPIFLTKDKEIYVGEEYKIEDFASVCHDISGVCNINYTKEEYGTYNEAGEYNIELIATDKYGNETNVTIAKLTIKAPDKEIYTVTFDSDGGSSVASQKVEEGNKVLEPSVVKEGYTFLGWYLGNNKYDFNTPITSNITLKARWQKVGGGNVDVPSVISVTSVTLNYVKKNLIVGETFTLKVTVRPSNATNRSVSWSSSDSSIVSVENGKLMAKKTGTAIITASAGGKKATTTVVVGNNSACIYGDTNYNKDLILSVNLTQNNCAIKPNHDYNELLSTNDYAKLDKEVGKLGYKINGTYVDIYKITKIYNNSGTGLVGIQISVNATVTNGSSTKKISYILKSDGSRIYTANELGL